VGIIVAIMGCIGSLSAALLIWLIGVVSKSYGFDVPFFMIAGLAALGFIPAVVVRWESTPPTDEREFHSSVPQATLQEQHHG
jgi:sugar phosphate permease